MPQQIYNGDCLEVMKYIPDNSIDLIFCDLPYGCTSCKWDCPIDLEKLWAEYMRIKKLNTPIFLTTTTKFGVSLINSAPKKCPFRYDLVWVKSAPSGFLCAKKMPMRKHELVYVFYEKLPLYDLSSHKHKFLKEDKGTIDGNKVYAGKKVLKREPAGKYDPLLPTSVIKEQHNNHIKDGQIYNGGKAMKVISDGAGPQYDPPLPTSVISTIYNNKGKSTTPVTKHPVKGETTGQPRYDPPLPTSVIKEKGCYGEKVPNSEAKYGQKCARQYDPPLPVSVIKEESKEGLAYKPSFCQKDNADNQYRKLGRKGGESAYDPPLPTSILEISSKRGKHSTQKPVALMSWVLKYYSHENDIILDNCMGSGSTGVACKEMNRRFIGIEMDKDIFKVAEDRLK
tara:strand:+ start:404 stop:1591 length:1188 start_codon:yes stop_codon:yes gene_type:complete